MQGFVVKFTSSNTRTYVRSTSVAPVQIPIAPFNRSKSVCDIDAPSEYSDSGTSTNCVVAVAPGPRPAVAETFVRYFYNTA
ncbi:hypothetical protein PC128_g6722 [Phytophthora cactorum]|nr:hypothetical protein PC128_g6722 [Phytophthora cactorum]